MPNAKSLANLKGGSRKGVPNKNTAALKDMILQALNEADPNGGVAYLKTQATQNPASFLTLVGKVLPLQVAGDPANPITHVVRVELAELTDADRAG
jgi:hypothetical protein